MLPEFLIFASKSTIETSDSVVILAIADFGSATGAARAKPDHFGCPWEGHGPTVVLLAVNSSFINWWCPGSASRSQRDWRAVNRNRKDCKLRGPRVHYQPPGQSKLESRTS